MWQPTHVQVTVQRAKGLLIKGKNDTNDALVMIALGKERFQTSIKEKSSDPVEWHEECDLEIPAQGNTAAVQLTVLHRNGLGLDEFLGQVSLPLSDFDVYERPRTKSYKLQGKPDKSRKKAEKERGEIEAKIAFIVKSGEFLDVAKKEKHKSSLTSLKHLGGSLLSIGNKDKNSLKKFTKSVSNRMDKIVPKKKRSGKSDDSLPPQLMASRQWSGEADPGVISDEDDDDDLAFDDVKVGSTVNSSPYSTASRTSSRHLPRLPDEDSLAGASYSGIETSPVSRYGATRQMQDQDDREDEVAQSSSAASEQQQFSPLAPTASSPTEPCPPSPFTRNRLPNTALTRSKRRLVAARPPPVQVPTEPQVPVAASVQEEPSPPPSPEPYSLSLNFANLTPIELPPPKPKQRKISAYDDVANATNEDVPTAQPLAYNPFDVQTTVAKEAPKSAVLPANPFDEEPPKNPFDEDDEETNNPFTVAATPKNPFEENETDDRSNAATKSATESHARAAEGPAAVSSSLTSNAQFERTSNGQFERNVKKSRAPPIPTQRSTKVDLSKRQEEAPEIKDDVQVSARSAEAARRRSSVPALAGLQRPDSSNPSTFEISRSSSGSVITTAQSEMFPRMGTPSYSSKPYFELHDSPPSTHSGVSSRGAASGATGSLCSMKDDGDGTGGGGLGGRSGDMVRGGSVKEKRSSQPLEDEWERKLCGKRSTVGSLERLSAAGAGGGSSRSSLNNSCASSLHDLQPQLSPADHLAGGGTRFPEVKALTLDRSAKLPTFEDSSETAKKQKRKGLKNRLFSRGSNSRVEEEGRVVEGGNDKLPNAPATNPHSRLSQDIHNKFAGKSREDLMEQILTLQSLLERQARHGRDLEEYIDNLLSRVMDASPHLLQAPGATQPSNAMPQRPKCKR
ncbi:rab11 family-interacting protein 1 isoform X2 [Hyalella azteca]|uniref:Rab11 family-interacting protein 1 isoform X2 n=1 Tax=Hyalella azteca TaxID=294128 RepID=A0A8B7PHJ2_HYAAZ|nr:rab11 family-interacting protein 1 isoform X2 [Hyalella azteca]